jgi:hypothetical protein
MAWFSDQDDLFMLKDLVYFQLKNIDICLWNNYAAFV